MKNTIKSVLAVSILALFSITNLSCNKEENIKLRGLKKVYAQFKDGMIQECTYQGRPVFVANTFYQNSVFYIFDEKGNDIGFCNMNSLTNDSICLYLRDCGYIYIPETNGFGIQKVDVYGLSK